MNLPTGTVTFLFTDIEGSTRLWEEHPEAMRRALAHHDVLMHQSITAHDGVVFKTIGDAFCAAFATASQALRAAFTAQTALKNELWPDAVILRVRMALHTGTPNERDGDYFGPPLNRVARLLSAGHGGQTLLSLATQELTRDVLPSRCSLQDLGQKRLKDLGRPEHVFQLVHPDLPNEFPPLKSLDNPESPNNLPQQVTSFVGRERELGQVKDLLAKTRLLTLTGSGGCGKTRLSLQVAADILDQYSDGVWLVELASLSAPGLVPQAVAAVLGVTEQSGRSVMQTLTDSLKSKTLLLILDNCEHVLTASAQLADALLRNCPNVQILASSREGLGIAGETLFRIPSLSLPDRKLTATPESLSHYEAVRLFIDRAMLVQPDFTVTNQNAPALASICHRVDGIPLALELAAARVRSLPIEEINARLDNRFRLLTGGSRTALPRQQTLRALIDWSYDLLTDQEKSLLQCLSVFAGGWALPAAEAVCVGDDIEDWEVLDLITALVDKSLVIYEAERGEDRYHLLETIRQYARDRMAESDEGLLVRSRHRDYFLQFADEADLKLSGPEQAHWLSQMETEHDNLRQAMTFCLEDANGAEKGVQLGSLIQQFWWTRGHLSEGRERYNALLSRPEAQAHSQDRADALIGAGGLAWMQGDYVAARALFQDSLVIQRELGNTNGIASVLANLGLTAHDQGDYAAARTLLEESLDLQRELGNKTAAAMSMLNLGRVATSLSDYDLARTLFEESLAIQREMGNKNGIALGLVNLGGAANDRGEYAIARLLLQECLEIRQELEDNNGMAYVLHHLGNAAQGLGDSAEARSLLQQSLSLRRDLGDKDGIIESLEAFATLALNTEQSPRTARLLGAAQTLREAISAPRPLNERAQYDLEMATTRSALGDSHFEFLLAEGQAMSLEQAVEYALGD